MLKDFADIVSPKDDQLQYAPVIEENAGINRYVSNLAKDDLQFQNQLKSFYDDIKKQPYRDTSGTTGIVTINQSAGDGNHPSLKAGWLWQKALDHSGNDPNRAMQLIGACGHDDQAQGPTDLLNDSDEQVKIYNDRKAKVDEWIKKLKLSINTTFKPQPGTQSYTCPDVTDAQINRLNTAPDHEFQMDDLSSCPI